MNGLGVRQRKMLTSMLLYGDGGWPDRWSLRHDHYTVLDSLFKRGLVDRPDNMARLTDQGTFVAGTLCGPIPRPVVV